MCGLLPLSLIPTQVFQIDKLPPLRYYTYTKYDILKRYLVRFYNRKRELALLDKLFARPGGQMFVLYGRRRVGKTALLGHWLETRKHPALFWTADRTSATAQLRSFSRALRSHTNPSQPVPDDFTYGNWESALDEVARLAQSGRVVVVLDEFTYLIESEPALPSILQRLWDHQLKHSNLALVLTGSHAGMIEREVLTYRSPLYNRATSSLHLQPMSFGVLPVFLPKYSAEERAAVYACVGGVPQYLELFDTNLPVKENIEDMLTNQMIVDDAGALLRDQLGDPRNYVAVVEAIASGFTRMSEIAKMAGLPLSNISKYLDVLQHLSVIARQVPATVSKPEQSKQGRYQIIDHYLRFYYRFIAPSRSEVERGRIKQVSQNIQKHLSEFVGTYVFEEISREWVSAQADSGRLPFVPRRVGSFWGSGKPQIDVVAINEDEHALLLGECKWTAEPIRKHVVEGLLARAPQVIPEPVERWQVTYALFSRSGFTDEARQAMKGHKCLWVSLDQLDADLREV